MNEYTKSPNDIIIILARDQTLNETLSGMVKTELENRGYEKNKNGIQKINKSNISSSISRKLRKITPFLI
jgi:hypothetical protein